MGHLGILHLAALPYQRDWDDTVPEDWEPSLAIARIEAHYFVNQSFLPYENYLLDGAKELDHIPTTIVNGRYDVICPCKTAFELYDVMPHADMVIVPNTGHSSMEQGTSDVLTQAMDRYRKLERILEWILSPRLKMGFVSPHSGTCSTPRSYALRSFSNLNDTISSTGLVAVHFLLAWRMG